MHIIKTVNFLFNIKDISGGLTDVNLSPRSSVSEGFDHFPESPLHR